MPLFLVFVSIFIPFLYRVLIFVTNCKKYLVIFVLDTIFPYKYYFYMKVSYLFEESIIFTNDCIVFECCLLLYSVVNILNIIFYFSRFYQTVIQSSRHSEPKITDKSSTRRCTPAQHAVRQALSLPETSTFEQVDSFGNVYFELCQ